jgi:hypothetical protein
MARETSEGVAGVGMELTLKLGKMFTSSMAKLIIEEALREEYESLLLDISSLARYATSG